MLDVGSRVRVKENAFADSFDPADFEARGKVGKVIWRLSDDRWEVRLDDGEVWLLLGDELEVIDRKEQGTMKQQTVDEVQQVRAAIIEAIPTGVSFASIIIALAQVIVIFQEQALVDDQREQAMKHTPGPWQIGNDGGFWGQDCCVMAMDDGLPVVICDTVHSSAVEEKANMALITAAPDLLAACEAFVEAWVHCHQLEKTDVALRMAEAAITKARGERSRER